MTEPNYLVIGAPKAATTSLCHLLGKHPQVYMSPRKETFFFAYDQVYARGWDWYMSWFRDARPDQIAVGEGTTVYANLGTYPHTLERIVRHLPETRLIYITRHPVKRIESYWMELISQGLVTAEFNEAVRHDPQFLDTSLYWKQLSAYREHFPDERILLLFFEEFKTNPYEVLKRCFEFLGVDATVEVEGAEKPRYTSDHKRRDRAVTGVLRRHMPGFYAIRDSLPKRGRRAMAKVLKRPLEGRPQWDPAVRAWVVERLREDTRKFLEHCGKPADYWPLDAGDRIRSSA